ncbi:hypothetical protein K502DRAFT_289001 [Neoconidiobolus thromboides FSU 785]|nr:hypothetical protein K502DRAFT_289001 [Neoconidiobolus thromboides FSU 785]
MTTQVKNLVGNNVKFKSPIRPYYDLSNYALSPNAKLVAFATHPDPKFQAWKTNLHFHLVSTTGKPKLELILGKGLGAVLSGKFSSDDKYLPWVQMTKNSNEYSKGLIILYNLKTKNIKVLNNNEWNA